ncbi:MAG: hypothetical protein JOY94_21215, partial [Methylobacteriaceae bacterium]|nr:hypothetical protein [Methylobacteriaceae bacterium]
ALGSVYDYGPYYDTYDYAYDQDYDLAPTCHWVHTLYDGFYQWVRRCW